MAGLYLASTSPRRSELLAQIGVHFATINVVVDESPLPDESASVYVQRLALAKARAGAARLPEGKVVLGADTCGLLDGEILGKPANRVEGVKLLQRLSGRAHQVLTAVAVVRGGLTEVRVVASEVRFRPLTLSECQAYWDTGEPADKAGGYAIQGFGAVFVQHLEGSYSAVVGLPLCETAQLLGTFGVACWQTRENAP